MKCKQFELNAADWVSNRLSTSMADEMQSHALVCAACHRVADSERSLQDVFQSTSLIERTPDLWVRLERKISDAPARTRFNFQRLYALGGVAACAGLLVFTLITRSPQIQDEQHPVIQATQLSLAQEKHVVEMVANTQVMPDSDQYSTTSNPHSAEGARLLLVGGPVR